MVLPYIFSFLSGIVLPIVNRNASSPTKGIGNSFGFGAFLCFLSFISAALFAMLDRNATHHDKQIEMNMSLILQNEEGAGGGRRVAREADRGERVGSSGLGGGESNSTDSMQGKHLPSSAENDQDETTCSFSYLTRVRNFELGYWLMATDCVISYGFSFTLIAIGNEMLQSRFNYSEEQASFYITMPYFLVGIMTPSLGYLADQIGKR